MLSSLIMSLIHDKTVRTFKKMSKCSYYGEYEQRLTLKQVDYTVSGGKVYRW